MPHAPEEREHEDDHGDELEEEVKAFPEVHSVHRLKADTERHLSHAEDDWGLHLHGVEEQELKQTKQDWEKKNRRTTKTKKKKKGKLQKLLY